MVTAVSVLEARTLILTFFTGTLYKCKFEVMVPCGYGAYVMPSKFNRRINFLIFCYTRSPESKGDVCYEVEVTLDSGVAVVSHADGWDRGMLFFGGSMVRSAPINHGLSLLVWQSCTPHEIQGVNVY